MTGVRFPSIEDYNDIAMKNKYKEEVEKGRDPQEVFDSLLHLSRDNSRTPMQWDDSKNAGFTSGSPWIKVNPNYTDINAAKVLEDPASIYYYYKKLIELRKENDVMVYGDYETILEDHEQIYAYVRKLGDKTWLVLLNVSEEKAEARLPEALAAASKEVIITNYPDADAQAEGAKGIALEPYHAVIYQIQ